MKHLAVLCVLCPLWLSPPAGAAQFPVLEDECHGRQLMIKGPIEAGDAERFAAQLTRMISSPDLPASQDPDVLWTLRLDSPGGEIAEAMAIGRLVHAAFITTEVNFRFEQRADGVWDFARGAEVVCLEGDDRLSGCVPDAVEAACTGACLLIWLAGSERRAIEGRLGAHGLAGDPAALTAYLREIAIEPAATELILARARDAAQTGAEAPQNGWLDWTDRKALAGTAPELEVLVAGCPPALTPEEAMQSVMTRSPAERAALLDRSEAYWDCRNSLVEAARATPLAALVGMPGRG
ncbi:MAG: hypothetical protein R3E86_14285 [Pseudomonadales bacterium]